MTAIRYGTLATGVDMMGNAVKSLFGDARAVFHTEIDPAAALVLAELQANVPNLGDLTSAAWCEQEHVEVLVLTVPCQGWSVAGKQGGSLDERDLWPVLKVDGDGKPRRGAIDAIRALMPDVILFENVTGLLTAENGMPFGVVLADLDALGYSVAWTVLGACKVGACHHRHRVFLYATRDRINGPDREPYALLTDSAGVWSEPRETLFDQAPVVTRWPQAGVLTRGFVWEFPADPCGLAGILLPTPTPTPTARDAVRGAGRTFAEGRPLSEVIALLPREGATCGDFDRRPAPPALGATPAARDGGARGTPSPELTARRKANPDRSFNLEDAIALLPPPTATPYGHQQSLSLGAAIRPSLEALAQMNFLPTPRASDADKGGPNQRGSSGDLMLPSAVQPGVFGDYELAVRRHEQTLWLPAPSPTEPGRLGKPRLSAAFVEFMMGAPAGEWTELVSRKDAIRIGGNGVVRQAAAAAFELLRARLASLTAIKTAA